MKAVFQFLVQSNLLLAVISALFVYQLQDEQAPPLLFFAVACGVFSVYNILKILKFKQRSLPIMSQDWTTKHYSLLRYSLLLSTGLLMVQVFQNIHFFVNQLVEILMVSVALLLYHFGQFRKVTLLKNIMIATVWTIVTVEISFHAPNSFLLGIFLIYLTLSLQSDIKDFQHDAFRFPTLVQTIGKKNSTYLIQVVFLLGLMVFVYFGFLSILKLIFLFALFLGLQYLTTIQKNYRELCDVVLVVVAYMLNI
jgi:hypothetical protein